MADNFSMRFLFVQSWLASDCHLLSSIRYIRHRQFVIEFIKIFQQRTSVES